MSIENKTMDINNNDPYGHNKTKVDFKKKIKDEYNNAVEKIIVAMENNGNKWKKSWVSVIPQNFLTKKPYRGFNSLYLPLAMDKEGHTSPYFLTFVQAKQLKGKVKKGSKSYPVFFYQFYYQINVILKNGVGSRVTVKAFNDHEALKKASELSKVKEVVEIIDKNGFMIFHRVFNMDDIEGIDTSKDEATYNNSSINDIDNFISSTGALIIGGLNPCYNLSLDIINMPSLNKFTTKENYYATLFHELTHWTGAKKRLNRDNFYSSSDKDYAFEELVAELGSLFFCMNFNVDTEDTQHPEYLKGWIRKLKDDPKYIWKASSLAQRAVSYSFDLSKSNDDKKVA